MVQREVTLERNVLHKSIAFASPSHRVLMKVDKLQVPEGLKNLLYVALREIEMKRTNIESI
jgi:hypothetical protein